MCAFKLLKLFEEAHKIKCEEQTEKIKNNLNEFNNIELRKIIDTIKVVKCTHLLMADYAEFEYILVLNEKILIKNAGYGNKINLETKISYKEITDSKISYEEIFKMSYKEITDSKWNEINIEKTLNELYNLLNLKETDIKTFEKFMQKLFSFMEK